MTKTEQRYEDIYEYYCDGVWEWGYGDTIEPLIQSIAEEFHVSTRTVRRAIAMCWEKTKLLEALG